jgi:hypothetical protein
MTRPPAQNTRARRQRDIDRALLLTARYAQHRRAAQTDLWRSASLAAFIAFIAYIGQYRGEQRAAMTRLYYKGAR